jgi:hypothetical protein
VWLHHKLLDEFPAEFAALADKGFRHCVGAYLTCFTHTTPHSCMTVRLECRVRKTARSSRLTATRSLFPREALAYAPRQGAVGQHSNA